MARSVDAILTQLMKLLPGHYDTAEALLSGIPAALAAAETVTEALQLLGTIEDSEGVWLTLQAHGYGIRRATDELDETLKMRLRTVEDQVTKPAIAAAVDRLIAPDTCEIVEHWDSPYLDDETETGLWLDNDRSWLSGGPNSFLVVIPRQLTGFEWGSYLDNEDEDGFWLDDGSTYLGEGPEDPVYEAIVNEVNRLRAAGVFWRLVLTEG